MTKNLGGVWPAMITPLREDGTPNLEVVDQLVETFVSQNLGGLYILGSTGQWPLLSVSDRRDVAERVVQTAAGRIPVIVHVGAAATDDAVELTRHAESIAADGVSSVTPIYYPQSVDGVFEHYRRIGEASSLPLYVYHLSSVNQVSLGAREYAKRVLDLPNIGGMKITDVDLNLFGLISETVGDRLQLFSGADPLVCHAALSGAIGAIGTFFNLWGDAATLARQRFVEGDFEAGRRFSAAIQTAIEDIIRARSIWSFLESAMRLKYGIEIGRPRAPLGALDEEWDDADVERLIQRVDASV